MKQGRVEKRFHHRTCHGKLASAETAEDVENLVLNELRAGDSIFW